MGANNRIFNIIKSLTMNEKRAFKIYCKKHTLKDKNKYILLFEAIDHCNDFNDFNEKKIKESLEINGYSNKYFSSDKNYLNEIILKSLNEFHAKKTCDLKIKQNLISIEIMFYKGLYKECIDLINKTKRIKLINESQYLILEVLKWEKKCLGYSKGLSEAIKTNNSLDKYFKNIIEEKKITDFYYKSYFYKNSIGKSSREELKEKFNKMFLDPVFKYKDDKRSVHTNIYFNLIFANYYNISKENEKELDYLRKVIVFFDNNKIYKYENPLDFISIYIRIIDINKQKQKSTFYEDLKKLREFDNFINIQDKVSKERIFLHSYQAEIEYLLNFNNSNKAFEIMNEMQIEFKKHNFTIEPYYTISTYYLFASIHCSLGDFSEGLKYVNSILNEYKFNQRPNTFLKTEFLNIVIHYELKNYELIQKNIFSLKKKYKTNFKLSFLEKNILKTILKIINNPNIIKERSAFSKLKIKIESSKKLKSSIEKNYFNYIVLKANNKI
jgi:hypothetical protein